MQEGRKRKMKFPKTGSVLFLCYVMLMLSEHVSMALSLRLSKILQPTDPLREEERVQPQER